MRGVDFSNTSYRRMYLPTASFKLLGCEAQSVYWALRPLFDPGGYFRLNGSIAAEAVAVEIGWSIEALEFIERGLDRLLHRQWLFYDKSEDALVDPDFYDAEHATKSGKQRARDSRNKKKGDDPTSNGRSAPDRSTDAQRRPRRKIGFQMSSEHFSPDGLPTSSRLTGPEIPVPGHGVDGHPVPTPRLESSRLGPMGSFLDRSEPPPTSPTRLECPPKSLPSASLESDPQNPAHLDEPISMSIGDGSSPDETVDQPAIAHVDEPGNRAPISMSIGDGSSPGVDAPIPMSIGDGANPDGDEPGANASIPMSIGDGTTPDGSADQPAEAHVDEPGDDAPISMSIGDGTSSEGLKVKPKKVDSETWSMPEGGIEFGAVTLSAPVQIRLIPASVTDSDVRYARVTFSGKCDAPVTNSPSQYPVPITQCPKSVVLAEVGPVYAGACGCADGRARASPPLARPPDPEPPPIVESRARTPDALPEAEPDAVVEPTTTRREQDRKPGRQGTGPPVPETEPPRRSQSDQARTPNARARAEPDAVVEPTTTRREEGRRPGRQGTGPPVSETEPPKQSQSDQARPPDVRPRVEPNARAEPRTPRRELRSFKRLSIERPVPEARLPSRGHRDRSQGAEFEEFVRYVERCYRHSAKLQRGLNHKEHKRAREWFDRGIDAGMVREAFAEEGEFEPGAVWSLGFYERTVLRVWKSQRELAAGAQSADTSTTDFDEVLSDLIALVPESLPGRSNLVASIDGLRGLAIETIEERLREIEQQYLASMSLTIEQKKHIDGLMSQLARRLPSGEFSKQRKRLAVELKRESLGLPYLSLFNEKLSQRSSSFCDQETFSSSSSSH